MATKFAILAVSILMVFLLGCSEAESGQPVEFAKACDAENNGKLVQVPGYFAEKGTMMWCRGNSQETKCGLQLLEDPKSTDGLSVDVVQGSSANNIEKLERNYKPEDVKIHANDGSVVGLVSEKVMVSGTMLVSPENKVCNMAVSKIEK